METIQKNFSRKHSGAKALVFALMVIAAGIFFLLNNMGLVSDEVKHIVFSWPMLVVAIGLLNITGRTFWLGGILILFGGIFIVADIYDLPIEFGKVFWPSLLILAGLIIIWFAIGIFKGRSFTKSSSSADYIEEISIFGGTDKIISSKEFKGGKIVNIFGGGKIDFREAELAPGINNLEFVNIFGGATLMVPSGWQVRTEVVSIFGGFVDKRAQVPVDESRTLYIRGVAIFGGGEIKWM
ncbi:MAG: DUF5668 domain-containing protein [Bacteroidota bacterium]